MKSRGSNHERWLVDLQLNDESSDCGGSCKKKRHWSEYLSVGKRGKDGNADTRN